MNKPNTTQALQLLDSRRFEVLMNNAAAAWPKFAKGRLSAELMAEQLQPVLDLAAAGGPAAPGVVDALYQEQEGPDTATEAQARRRAPAAAPAPQLTRAQANRKAMTQSTEAAKEELTTARPVHDVDLMWANFVKKLNAALAKKQKQVFMPARLNPGSLHGQYLALTGGQQPPAFTVGPMVDTGDGKAHVINLG